MRRIIVVWTLMTIGPFTLGPQRETRKPGHRVERPVPFEIGETLTYGLSWASFITAGTAVATVQEKKPSFDSTAYYIVAEGRSTSIVARLYSLYYKLDTLLDSYSLLSQRGSVYSEEGGRHRYRVTRFDQAAHQAFFEYQTTGTAERHFTVPPYTQDALSAIYVLRAVPLKTGDRMTMPVSDNGLNYTLQVDVGPSEHLQTAIGDRVAWKLTLAIIDPQGQPQGRNVALWISDDARRLPLKIQGDLPVGTFDLDLRDVK